MKFQQFHFELPKNPRETLKGPKDSSNIDFLRFVLIVGPLYVSRVMCCKSRIWGCGCEFRGLFWLCIFDEIQNSTKIILSSTHFQYGIQNVLEKLEYTSNQILTFLSNDMIFFFLFF